MANQQKYGLSYFMCLGGGGAIAILGLLAVGANRSIGDPTSGARTLDYEHILWGFPWWIGNRLGAPVAWLLVIGGVLAVVLYLMAEAKKNRTQA